MKDIIHNNVLFLGSPFICFSTTESGEFITRKDDVNNLLVTREEQEKLQKSQPVTQRYESEKVVEKMQHKGETTEKDREKLRIVHADVLRRISVHNKQKMDLVSSGNTATLTLLIEKADKDLIRQLTADVIGNSTV